MEEIGEGEFFPVNTSNRQQAIKILLKRLKRNTQQIGNLVQLLHVEEEVYTQKKDCKDFIRNCIKSSNHEINKVGRWKIALTNQIEVEN